MGHLGQRNLNQPELFAVETKHLIQHSIFEENSNYRTHVSFCNKTIYLAKTPDIIKAIKEGKGTIKFARDPQFNIITSEGWVIPWSQIQDIKNVYYPEWPHWNFFNDTLDTPQKSKMAVSCVLHCLENGKLPICLTGIEEKDIQQQIDGVDMMIIVSNCRIQVKCDARAGKTGNLYIEKAERNLGKKY